MADAKANTEQEPAMSRALADIVAERQHQIRDNGYDAAHDDGLGRFNMARAGAAYAMLATGMPPGLTPYPWPWATFKDKGSRQNLVRAAALLAAEIERGDRTGFWEAEEARDAARIEQNRRIVADFLEPEA